MPFLEPTHEQLQTFAEAPEEGPIVMVNLLRFKENGGRETYARYAEAVLPLVVARGGRLVYRGQGGPALIGNDAWDETILVEYPTRQALLEMLSSEAYQAIAHLRQDALHDSRLHLTRPT